MSEFHIKKGKNIKMKGEASKELIVSPLPKQAAVQPLDLKGLKSRVVVKVNDIVKVGSPVLVDKVIEGLQIVSPVSGKVVAINRGAKRSLISIVIESDEKQTVENFDKFSRKDIQNSSREKIIKHLLEGGLWAVIRQRPFSKIAHPQDTPKSIFIHAMNTEPLAADMDFVLDGQESAFQTGLDIIKKLTDGDMHLCVSLDSTSKALTATKGVQIHKFSGSHPVGNVSTHIHYIDPIHKPKRELVWYIEAQDVVRIASLFLNGTYPNERIVAITGEGAKNRVYAKTIMGAPLKEILKSDSLENMRCLTGSILVGRDIGKDGFLGFYDSQITIIPEGGKRELLGWLSPGVDKYTFSKTFLSSFMAPREFSLDTDTNGSPRAIVMNHIYDTLNTLDILTYFLLKAIISGDIEEAERLGILECDEEDFALCTFACPSKVDVGGYIREGLDLIESEG